MTNDFKLPPYKVEDVVSTLAQATGWGIKQLNVPVTWTVTQGEGITVLVLDTGCSYHPDLSNTIILNKSKSFVPGEPSILDENGHSTHCCGIIGASNNNMGMVGVAPGCKIITGKVLGTGGSGSFKSIAEGLEYAIKIKPDVVSMSIGSSVSNSRMHKAIKKLYELNIPIIAAAGNDGASNAVNYPGKYEETICVTAFDAKGAPAGFNSTGDKVDFSAPGVDIYSTWLDNRYVKLSGTSMATPFITGLVCLLLAKHKKQEKDTGKNDCKTVQQIKEHLIKYADDKGIVGKDDIWGYGVIDPQRLIAETESISIPQKKTLKNWFEKICIFVKSLF